MQLHHLAWDSSFFRFEVARLVADPGEVTSESVMAAMKADKYELVYWESMVKRERIESNFIVTQVHLAFCCGSTFPQCKRVDSHFDQHKVFAFSGEVNENLISLAKESGHLSRYKIDTCFASGVFDRLYTTWIQRSCSGEIASVVLVGEVCGEIKGFISMAVNGPVAKIGLFAVHKECRGMGLGRRLLREAVSYACDRGCVCVDVTTQAENLAALKLYRFCNFFETRRSHWYHFWSCKKT